MAVLFVIIAVFGLVSFWGATDEKPIAETRRTLSESIRAADFRHGDCSPYSADTIFCGRISRSLLFGATSAGLIPSPKKTKRRPRSNGQRNNKKAEGASALGFTVFTQFIVS